MSQARPSVLAALNSESQILTLVEWRDTTPAEARAKLTGFFWLGLRPAEIDVVLLHPFPGIAQRPASTAPSGRRRLLGRCPLIT